MMDNVGSLLAQFVTLAAAVWAFCQMVPSGRVNKTVLAFLVGPIFGVIAYALGLVHLSEHVHPVPDLPDRLHRLMHWAGAAFMGLISTVLAKGAHDVVIDPLLKRGRGSGKPTQASS